MAGRKRASSMTRSPVIERKHCPKCTYYLDGHQVMNEDPGTGALSLFFFPIPGMQFHQKTTGTEYEKRGFATPCTCTSGNLVAAGYEKDRGYRSASSPRESKPEVLKELLTQMKPQFTGTVPMPMDNF